MMYQLYNDDVHVASFEYDRGVITSFHGLKPQLLPMQIRDASAEMFTLWIQERAIDLNTFVHRELMRGLLGSRDRVSIALKTHMFSITDKFTCFEDGDFTPRADLWSAETQDTVSDFILVSSDTSLRLRTTVTPNAATDGSFPKTWRYEDGTWWLYKVQSPNASRSECAISRALRACGWDAAEYVYDDDAPNHIKTRNFVGHGEFFEPYDSLRYMFEDKRDNEEVVYANIRSLGADFEQAYRRILLADALFMNSDRHMRNFGVIRSSTTGQILRMAPNFDNNQAYKSSVGIAYSDAMLRMFKASLGWARQDEADLAVLSKACAQIPYLVDAVHAGEAFLS